MRNKLTVVIIISFLSFFLPDSAKAAPQQNFSMVNGFDVNLTGYEQYSFGSFNQIGYRITPLANLYFRIIQEEHEWIDEPRLYIKGNKGYIHLWKKDGTNVLYKVEKQPDGMWKVLNVQRKKINRIPVPKKLLKEALIERLVDPISKAIDTYYVKPKLWFRSDEKVLKIEKDKHNYILYVTVQVQTFEGAHNPPYGEDTITFKIKGDKIVVSDFKHRDIPKDEWSKLHLR